MNDQEREMWIINDEGLYWWFRRRGLSMTAFLRENRDELTRIIRAARDKEPSRCA